MIKKCMKIITTTIIIILFFFILTSPVQAEVAVFSWENTRCRPISLTETLNITSQGVSNAGCTFNLNVRATGDWVLTGGYFDTPPYGWGGDNFYSIDEADGYIDPNTGLPNPDKSSVVDYSYTCEQPTYKVNQALLPAYAKLVGSGTDDGTGTSVADGEVFSIKLDATAPLGATFNIPVTFNSNCDMFRRDKNGEIIQMWTVSPSNMKCQKQAAININPRTATRNYTVTVGRAACGVAPTATPIKIKTPTPSRTPIPTPTPDPLAKNQGWFKFKDASFHRQGIFRDSLSPDMTTFDSDDTLDMYPLIGNVGVLTASSKTIDIGSDTEYASKLRWERDTFIDDNSFLNDISSFLNYAVSEKNVSIITSPSQVQSNKINIIKANTTFDNQSKNKIPNNVQNYILIVEGDLTLANISGTPDIFNDQGDSAAIIATGAINIHSDYTEINGIFIGQSINLAYDPAPPTGEHPNPLKINGNIISGSPINDLRRSRTDDDTKPTIFTVFKPKMYVDLLPLLSVIVRESSQIQ
ncbi:hypothetical protein BH09PAT2_BH09PAT2_05920 [soil metagenome]